MKAIIKTSTSRIVFGDSFIHVQPVPVSAANTPPSAGAVCSAAILQL